MWSSGLGCLSGKQEALGSTPTGGDFLFCLISVSKNLIIFKSVCVIKSDGRSDWSVKSNMS